MPFNILSTSNYDGAPIALYEFQRDSTYWRYAAFEQDVTVGGNTYVAWPIEDRGVTQSGDTTQDEFTIDVPLNTPVALAYLHGAPSGSCAVRVRHMHDGDTEAAVVWVGLLDRVEQSDEAKVSLICRNALASLQSGGARLAWTRECPHLIYDSECKAVRNSFRRTGTVVSISGATVFAPGLAAGGGQVVGALRAGYLEWTTTEGFVERRTILDDGDGFVTLLGGIGGSGLLIGTTVYGYIGCQRTPEYCNDVVGNLANYGGFPKMPGKSPFDGNPVF